MGGGGGVSANSGERSGSSVADGGRQVTGRESKLFVCSN
jgi:hypothetical protein